MWACNTALGAPGPSFMRVDPWEVTQKYCGQLLKASIKIVCKGRSQKVTLAEFEKQESNRFLINACCTKECNLKFIQAHCPDQRTKSHNVNSSTIPAETPTPVPVHTIMSTTTTTTSTTTSTTTRPPPTKPTTSPILATQESHGLWYYVLFPLHNPFYSNFYLP
ncbi:unnamed protein product [Aphis gossypii]|uniref:Insulin-like domain-containing protein n=1 Tax=Aphis gossypii TaxID=80765 RepID=A0A9P0JBC5_APHGO|nr:unnamed protein product [Aphis gossypii]